MAVIVVKSTNVANNSIVGTYHSIVTLLSIFGMDFFGFHTSIAVVCSLFFSGQNAKCERENMNANYMRRLGVDTIHHNSLYSAIDKN